MRDQDLIDDSPLGANAYDEYGPYDIDFSSASPSRPAPVPYDDPYSSESNLDLLDTDPVTPGSSKNDNGSHSSKHGNERGMGRSWGRDRGRGRGGHDQGDSRRDSVGRGRARGRGWGDRGRGSQRYENEARRPSGRADEPPDLQRPRSLSPTSLAIARVTGQLTGGSSVPSESGLTQQPVQMPIPPSGWQLQNPQMQPQQHQFNFGTQPSFVQPHINPRFASQFGMNFGYMQPRFYPQQGPHGYTSNLTRGSHSPGNWVDEWTVHGRSGADAGTGDQSTGTS